MEQTGNTTKLVKLEGDCKSTHESNGTGSPQTCLKFVHVHLVCGSVPVRGSSLAKDLRSRELARQAQTIWIVTIT